MSSTEDTIGSSSRGSDRDILSSIMTDEEAPIAIEEAIVPPASNGSSATAAVFTCKGDRKLSVVSKQYDIDGDGELDEAEQASKYYSFLHVMIDVHRRPLFGGVTSREPSYRILSQRVF